MSRGSCRRKGSKKKAQKRHAKIRAIQRYNLPFTKDVEKEILNALANNRTKHIVKQSNRVSIHEYTFNDNKTVRFVYDRLRKTIVSFIPLEKYDK